MRIYLTSVAEITDASESFKKVLSYLNENHHVFHYNHVTSDPQYSFNDLVEQINKADVFISEMSKPSQTLGFQLAHALQLSKPSLYLYDTSHKSRPEGIIGNIPSRGLKTKKYTSANYKKIIDDFISFADKQMDTNRTSFMSTKEIDEYLDRESKRQGLSKGEIIRQLLHKSMK